MPQDLISSYPRQRPALPERHAAIFAESYKSNREGRDTASNAAQRLEEWMHRHIASEEGGPILELGAGTLNHLRFEDRDEAYDIVEPFSSLFEGSPRLERIRDVYESQKQIMGTKYKRIVSVAVLEHMEELPLEIAISASLLEEDGIFQAGIPSEGGFLWWLGWRSTTGLSYYLRNKLDYGVVMRHEHLSTAKEIKDIVKWLFDDVTVKRWPFPSDQLSLYQYIEARSPRLDRARQLLERSSH